jgi:hypothetical protein
MRSSARQTTKIVTPIHVSCIQATCILARKRVLEAEREETRNAKSHSVEDEAQVRLKQIRANAAA